MKEEQNAKNAELESKLQFQQEEMNKQNELNKQNMNKMEDKYMQLIKQMREEQNAKNTNNSELELKLQKLNKSFYCATSMIMNAINDKLNKKSSALNQLYHFLLFFNKSILQMENPINIFDSIFIPNEASTFQEIIQLSDNLSSNIKCIGIHSNAIEDLYSDESFNLERFIINLLNSFKSLKFEFEIQSSSPNLKIFII